LLVVVAIISILTSMYLTAFSRARQQALQVVRAEGMRQEHLGQLADTANTARLESQISLRFDRDECREAYRKTIETSKGDIWVTQLLYVVRNEAEFAAYWHTLIDEDATDPLEYDGRGRLIAEDEDGNEFRLAPMGWNLWWTNARYGRVPVLWDFLSTDLGETSSGSVGANVLYADGHLEYQTYPGQFPVCRAVAELTHLFVLANDG
jgi:prepilin-type processing-associated H-X9-DG protein